MNSEPTPEGRLAPAADEVNMADVAARAGVSVATVSRALRDVAGVSPATRTRIREIAAEMAYVVSPEASGLSRRATRRVAVVVPRLDIWFYATMVEAVERELRTAELDVLLYQVDGQQERSRFVQELPSRRKVDAVVLVALPLTHEETQRIDAMLGAEVVVAGGRLAGYPSVFIDDRAIAAEAVQHLAAHGHRRVAMIRTDDTDGTEWSSDRERTRGYRDAVRDHGLAENLVVTAPYSADAGSVAMDRLLDLDEPPTAVFCYSDELACAAYAAVLRRGLRVPEDVSLIGVDGHPMSAVWGLDTIDQDVPGQGRVVGRTVAQLLAQDPDGPHRRDNLVRHRLVTRGSVGPPRPGILADRGQRT